MTSEESTIGDCNVSKFARLLLALGVLGLCGFSGLLASRVFLACLGCSGAVSGVVLGLCGFPGLLASLGRFCGVCGLPGLLLPWGAWPSGFLGRLYKDTRYLRRLE